MAHFTLITGGARSGKSGYAEGLIAKYEDVLYIATAIAFDDEMKDRIAQHKAQRPSHWDTLECYKDIGNHIKACQKKAILLDCVTIMLTNLLLELPYDWDSIKVPEAIQAEVAIMKQVDAIIDALSDYDGAIIAVTNEIGMGIVPPTPLGRLFRDIQGRVNKKLAARAEEAWLLVSGIAVRLK